MDIDTFLWGTLFFFFLMGAIGSVLSSRRPKLANGIAHVSASIGGILGIIVALRVMILQRVVTLTAWQIVPGISLTFRVDELSAFFLLVISLLAVVVPIYAIGYVKEYEQRIGWIGAGLNLFLLSMIAVVTVDNAFTFLIVWEVMSLVSFFLVMVEHEKEEVRRAGFIYVVMTHIGTAFIALAFFTLFLFAGDFQFASFAGVNMAPDVKDLVFILALIGFGTKAGMFPLHVWLPRAHPAAPSHISALMSAVMIKTAVYGLIRVIFDFLGGGEMWWGAVLIGLGMTSALFGILYGLVENDTKRFLAYSSSENMGIIFMGVGSAIIFQGYHHPLLAGLALTAALYHVLNHAIFKGLLFMGAGAVLQATHTRNINLLGGLIRRMPWTSLFFLIGGLALSALPPFNGFMSEWATFQSLLQLSFTLDHPVWKIVGGLTAAGLGLTGALVAGGVVKQFGSAFLAQPRTPQAERVREVSVWMRWGMGLLAVGSLVLGVWPGLALRVTSGVVEKYFHTTLQGNGIFFTMSGAGGGLSLGIVATIFLLMLLLTLAFLRIGVGKSRRVVDETWNCGTPLQPTMEYTGTSFSHPVLMIFQWLYHPERKVEIKGGTYYPQQISHRLHVQPTLETKVYRPMMRGILFLARNIRKIQSGNLQSYLVYMVVTLILLLLWFGGEWR